MKNSQRMAEYLQRWKRTTSTEISKDLNIRLPEVCKYLSYLWIKGKVKREGKTRFIYTLVNDPTTRTYRLKNYLKNPRSLKQLKLKFTDYANGSLDVLIQRWLWNGKVVRVKKGVYQCV